MSNARRSLAALVVVLATSHLSCGGGGKPIQRPAEALFFVRGVSGSPFQVTSLEAGNAAHVLAAELYQVPYTFVMLNAAPVASGVFKNEDPSLPITVTMVLGLDIVNVQQIPPGFCCIVAPGAVCVDTPAACNNPPTPFGREVRFDVISFSSTMPPPDNVPFTAAIGDLVNGTDVTSCVYTGSTVACQTPVSFFLEDAEETVAGVFNKADSSPIGVDASLLVDGTLKARETGRSNVIVQTNLD